MYRLGRRGPKRLSNQHKMGNAHSLWYFEIRKMNSLDFSFCKSVSVIWGEGAYDDGTRKSKETKKQEGACDHVYK